jgi:hypothetical protein
MTAGHNALRGSGPGQNLAFDDAVAHVGCPPPPVHLSAKNLLGRGRGGLRRFGCLRIGLRLEIRSLTYLADYSCGDFTQQSAHAPANAKIHQTEHREPPDLSVGYFDCLSEVP